MNKCFLGDCRDTIRRLIDEGVRVQTCVTSPPYWGLRNYNVDGQLGLEKTPEKYIENMVGVFSLVRRLRADDGTLWLNMGDSYCGGGRGGEARPTDKQISNRGSLNFSATRAIVGMKQKDLVGMPWLLAFALRADGWYLRQDIVWAKPNPMPESVTDRCTKAHEYIFLLTKSTKYYYDQEAILEPVSENTHARLSQNVQDQIGSERAHGGGRHNGPMKAVGRKPGNKTHKGTSAYEDGQEEHRTKGGLLDYSKKMEHKNLRRDDKNHSLHTARIKNNESFDKSMAIMPEKRNKRSVWTVGSSPYSEAHFATFPPKLIEPCILAGAPPGGIVFDPFFGSGTTGEVAQRLGRQWIGCELNPEYMKLQETRTAQQGLPL